MLPILIACVIWLPALVGLGIPVVTVLRRSTGAVAGSVAMRTTLCGLLGMFVASTLAAAANFFVAVYPVVSTTILAVGWVIVIRHHRRWTRLPRRAWQTIGLIIFVVALIDARGMPWYDTALYHLQAVQWLTHGPVPKGLANLYECLGYNCSWFTLAAAIETPLLLGKSCFVVNALLAIFIALSAVDGLLRHRGRHDRILLALMLIPVAAFGVDVPMISSLAPDPVVMLLVIVSIAMWVGSFRFAAHGLVLSCFAVTIKLSALPMLIMALVAMSMRPPRRVAGIIAICIIPGCIFLVRGIWLSGYAAYPSGISRISGLRWTAPPDLALHAAKEIAYWSRYTKVFEQVKPGTPWVGAWAIRMSRSQPMWIAVLLFTAGTVLFIYRRPRFTPLGRRCVAAMVALLPAIAFWFMTAPQVRFGYGYIFSLALLVFIIGISGIVLPKCKPYAAALSVLVLLLLMRIDRHFLKIRALAWPAIPTALLDAHVTQDGIVVHMPHGDDRGWDSPIPETTVLRPDLRCVRDSQGRIREWYVAPEK